ncbi:MAG: ABC transporter permease [Anaerostipes sp.]|nr:ABC transporter permease [Anaerostipes sp.]MDD3747678.1 ABC transporter permease [Anaerostipes sp.]
MKSIFYKSKGLIIIFAMIALMFLLAGMAIVKKKASDKNLPFLSDQYMVADFHGEYNQTTNKIAGEQLMRMKGNVLFIKHFSTTTYYAVYYQSKSMLPLIMKYGHMIETKDFQQKNNVVMLSESEAKNMVKENGKSYWVYDSRRYEVIGVYEDYDRNGNELPSCFVNYMSTNIEKDILLNQVLFDSKSNSKKNFYQFMNRIKKINPKIVVESAQYGEDSSDDLAMKTNNADAMISILVLTTILILLNTFSVTHNWMNEYRKEIAIRKMVGATNKEINCWIGKKYLILLVLSFSIGVLLVQFFIRISMRLPVKESVLQMYGRQINLTSLFIGVLFLFFSGVLVLGISLREYHNRQIVGEL